MSALTCFEWAEPKFETTFVGVYITDVEACDATHTGDTSCVWTKAVGSDDPATKPCNISG